MVTISSDPIHFNHLIQAGTLVELVGEVVKVGTRFLGRESKGLHGESVFRCTGAGDRRAPHTRGNRRLQATGQDFKLVLDGSADGQPSLDLAFYQISSHTVPFSALTYDLFPMRNRICRVRG